MPPKRLRVGDDEKLKVVSKIIREDESERKSSRKKEEAAAQKLAEKEKAKKALADEYDFWFYGLMLVSFVFSMSAFNDGDILGGIFILAFGYLYFTYAMSRAWYDWLSAVLINICLILFVPQLRRIHRFPGLLPWTSWLYVLPPNALIAPYLYWKLVWDKDEDDLEWWRNVFFIGLCGFNMVLMYTAGVADVRTIFSPILRIISNLVGVNLVD